MMPHVITSSYNHFIIMRTHRWPYRPCKMLPLIFIRDYDENVFFESHSNNFVFDVFLTKMGMSLIRPELREKIEIHT